MIDWMAISDEDMDIIRQIVNRASELTLGLDAVDLDMDLTACHVTEGPLDLQKLLDFDDFDFAHDVIGIYTHLLRTTGRLGSHFWPRCGSRKEQAA